MINMRTTALIIVFIIFIGGIFVLQNRKKINLSDKQTNEVKHSVPIDEIKQGCYGRDCIPSVDDPEFVTISKADELFKGAGAKDILGIGLEHNGEARFYPFNMLVTREIVNDNIAGKLVLVTYCPLCGTGIVFDRTLNGKETEFGVSGFLWQSNLLMYNRGVPEDEITLWSQILGKGIVGPLTDTQLTIIPSDIVFYDDWKIIYPDTLVLNTGSIGDPYNGEYYRVAKNFEPNFNETDSLLDPSARVYGINIDGEYKAYYIDALQIGLTQDKFAGQSLTIEKTGATGSIRVYNNTSDEIEVYPDGSKSNEIIGGVNGFWFSWVSAHPDTELFDSQKITEKLKIGNRVGDRAIDFTVRDYDGNHVKLSDYRGTPVFINFWASWCPFCVHELPLMVQTQQKFKDGYVTLAINRAEGVDLAKEFSDDLGISDELLFVLDDNDKIYKQYLAQGMPYSVFIDKDGVIQSIVRGQLTQNLLNKNLTLILKFNP